MIIKAICKSDIKPHIITNIVSSSKYQNKENISIITKQKTKPNIRLLIIFSLLMFKHPCNNSLIDCLLLPHSHKKHHRIFLIFLHLLQCFYLVPIQYMP